MSNSDNTYNIGHGDLIQVHQTNPEGHDDIYEVDEICEDGGIAVASLTPQNVDIGKDCGAKLVVPVVWLDKLRKDGYAVAYDRVDPVQ